MVNGGFKDFPRKTASDKVVPDKAFNVSKNLELDRYQRGLTTMVFTFFDKDFVSLKGAGIISENHQLTDELYKRIIRKFKKGRVYSFKDNICSADLADMQLLDKNNKKIRCLYVIDVFSEYFWVFPLKNKKKYCNY